MAQFPPWAGMHTVGTSPATPRTAAFVLNPAIGVQNVAHQNVIRSAKNPSRLHIGNRTSPRIKFDAVDGLSDQVLGLP